MGLFGGGNSKSVTTTNTETKNAGISDVSGVATSIQGSSNILNLLDAGAIDGAFDFAEELGQAAIGANTDLANSTIAAGRSTFDSAINAVNDNNELQSQLVLQSLDYNQALIGEGNRSEGATISASLIEKIIPVSFVVGLAWLATKLVKK